MNNKYYKAMYKILHIKKRYNVSYRYFKKASIKKYKDYLKRLKEATSQIVLLNKFESKEITKDDYIKNVIERG